GPVRRPIFVTALAPDEVGPEIDRQDDIRPHRAAQRDRDRIDDAPIDKVAIVVRYRTKQARHGYRSADRDRHLALAQPDLLSGMQIGGDRRKLYGQLGELAFDELLEKDFVHALALDEPAAQAEVRELEQPLPVERERPGLQLVEPARRKRGPDERSYRASRDEIGLDARLGEGAQDPDMRPAARRARAEHESDLGFSRHVFSPSPPSHPLENRCDPLPAADAHRDQCVALAGAVELVNRLDGED